MKEHNMSDTNENIQVEDPTIVTANLDNYSNDIISNTEGQQYCAQMLRYFIDPDVPVFQKEANRKNLTEARRNILANTTIARTNLLALTHLAHGNITTDQFDTLVGDKNLRCGEIQGFYYNYFNNKGNN